MDTKYIIAAIVVPLVVAVIGYLAARRGNKQTPQNNTGISAGGNVNISGRADIHAGDNIYTGITLDEYEVKIHRDRERIRKELQESIQNEEYEKQQKLEIELKAVGEKLNNLQQSFEEETKRRKEAVRALEKLEGTLPEAKIKEARKNLQSGDAKIAEELFDEVDEEGAVLVALAAYQSGQLAEGRIDYAKAMKKYRRAVALENSNPDYLLAAGIMARTLGEYKEAQPWLEKLLQLRQKETTETADLALTQKELAYLYYNMGNYEEAEPLYNRSLEITEKVFGKDHPEVAVTLNNLASLYYTMGNYEEAEPLYNRSLEITEKVLGKDHPGVAATLNNLAELYSLQFNYEEAEPLYNRSLEITEKALGKDHPEVAVTLNNLAELYKQQCNYEEAELLHNRSLGIYKKSLGADHPSVATTLTGLVVLYMHQGKYEEAEPLCRQSLGMCKKPHGRFFGETLDQRNPSRQNLAKALTVLS